MPEQDLRHAITKFTSDLAAKAESFVNDITTLEVRTFTTSANKITALAGNGLDLEGPVDTSQMQLRAYTKINFDCDTTICLPVDANNQVDRSVWDMHQTMVEQALKSRQAMLATMGDALSSALKALQLASE
ncbi:MAG: hypothetical protein P1S60_09985 [Anaerolineae bacterium]|nr:hypothetical protein [Anaerolineae bacterium]